MIGNWKYNPLRFVVTSLVAATVLSAISACNNVLDVQRPTLITEEQIARDPALLDAIAQGAIEPFRNEYAWVAHAGGGQSDEALLTHGWSPWNEYDDRNVTPGGGAYDGITYPFLQQARQATLIVVDRLKSVLGAKAATSPAYARANAYAGYSSLLAADHLCSIVIDKVAHTPDQIRQQAILLFQEAATAGTTANAPDVVKLANVGLARAYLGMNDKNNAITYAKKVPTDFTAYVGYLSDPDFGHWTIYNIYNRVAGMRSPAEFTMGYSDEMYGTLRDLRVPFETDSMRTMFDSRPARRQSHLIYEPESFSHWTPGGKKIMAEDAGIRFASGLEAQYIIAEASLNGGTGGMTNAEVLAFINSRRAVGAGAANPYTGTDLFGELRNQRKMDFMLAGFRMPDLLRYERFYGMDLWPKGQMEGFVDHDWVQLYGNSKCWPVGASERVN
jgi:hypothetical protein